MLFRSHFFRTIPCKINSNSFVCLRFSISQILKVLSLKGTKNKVNCDQKEITLKILFSTWFVQLNRYTCDNASLTYVYVTSHMIKEDDHIIPLKGKKKKVNCDTK